MQKIKNISIKAFLITFLLSVVSITPSLLNDAYAVVLTTVEETLKTFMPEADSIEKDRITLSESLKATISENAKLKFHPDMDNEFLFHIGKSNGQIIGYAVKDAVIGKWGLIYYMILLDPKGIIKNIKVLEYSEKRGKPVAKKRFLKQFFGKTINDRIKFNKDIKGVTGASISSRGMTNGVRKIVHIFNKHYLK